MPLGVKHKGRASSNGCGSMGVKRLLAILIFTVVLWTYSFMTFIVYRGDPNVTQGQKIKWDILTLSKQYVKELAKDNREGRALPESESSYDLKKTMAVLLDDLLYRVDTLEKKVDSMSNLSTHISAQHILRNQSAVSDGKSVPHLPSVQEGETKEKIILPDMKNLPEGSCEYTKEELIQFPHCNGKLSWMRNFWGTDKCYQSYGVDGSECSFIIYLSEIENWCPRLSWRPNKNKSQGSHGVGPEAHMRTDIDDLLNMLDNPTKFEWIKMRLRRMWDSMWIPAVESLQKRHDMTGRIQKRVLIHLGLLTKESGFKIAENAFSGGPLGELVQWADIIASLYILGHDLEISYSVQKLTSFLRLRGFTKSNCPLANKMPFDIIFIDIVGMKQMKKATGGLFQQLKCMLRVIDTFGTEPAFNLDQFAKASGYKSAWGKWNLIPRQFMTMFPHTPDNSFMGFVVEHQDPDHPIPFSQRENRALVYGKKIDMWSDATKYLDRIHQKFEIHATVFQNSTELKSGEVITIPSYVINHGIVPGPVLQNMLQQTKLFIGLGFPYEGPAPMEAIANGCAFLNPKFVPPKNSKNTKFFEGKPTRRSFPSQHPYAEDFIGSPHVWTVDISDRESLEKALDEISNNDSIFPYMPYEYTCGGMLQRVSVYVQNQEFCSGEEIWPPQSALKVITADTGVACKEACREVGLICEPAFFKYINSKEDLEEHFSLKCSNHEAVMDVYPPAVHMTYGIKKCHLQKVNLLFSCSEAKYNWQRLCPCREFIKGQVAFCPSCI